MITRIRIEAQGATAAEVENHLHWMSDRIAEALGETLPAPETPYPILRRGEQFIQREQAEVADSFCANTGRLVLHPNVADDAPQVQRLRDRYGCSTVMVGLDGAPTEFAKTISGGTPYTGIGNASDS